MTGAPTGRVRVLIADDQALVRAGFRMVVDAREDLEVVGEAAEGRRRWPWPPSSTPTSCSWTCGCR